MTLAWSLAAVAALCVADVAIVVGREWRYLAREIEADA